MDALTVLLGFLLSVCAAGVPTAAWSALVWWCDRYEREPVALGIGAFLWGALPAVAIALLLESALGIPSAFSGSALVQDVFASSGIAPLVEEMAKGIGLLLILLLGRAEFDDLLDGILYGALVGFGFGATENVLYFMSALLDAGWASWGFTVFLRAVVFGLNHAFFTAFTGAGIGIARAAGAGWVRRCAPWIGLGLAMLFHSLHNLGAALTAVSAGGLLLSLFAGVVGVLLVVAMIGLASRQEAGWVKAELGEEVGQVLNDAEYQALLSMRGRLSMVVAAQRAGGRVAARSARRFQELATELAFRKYRLRVHANDAGLAVQVAALRQRLAQARAAAEGISPSGPQSA